MDNLDEELCDALCGLDNWSIECEELVNMVAEATKLRDLKALVKKNFPDFWPEQ